MAQQTSSSSGKTVLIMAGGTGGHIFPALAVAECLKNQGWQVHWLGSPKGMEAKLVAQYAYPMAPIQFSALRGKGLLRKLSLPFSLLSACWQARRILRRIKPDVVLGMGGYISFPGGLMAALLGYPLVVHEQNAIPGLANRVLARLAQRLACGFPHAFGQRLAAQWTGNPVRADIAAAPPPAQRWAERLALQPEPPLQVLVIGGSLGAAALNEHVPSGIALIEPERRPQVVHQAGEKHLKKLQEDYAELALPVQCVSFIQDMAGAYAWADLVICRAGALTVAELAAVGVASIMVPFPAAVDDHQTANAQYLSRVGAAIVLPQSELTAANISLLRNYSRAQLLQMAERARELAKPDAAAAVAQLCLDAAAARRKKAT
ncbi:MAG: undecaprenyldiphospho-muramoylpentapeptide beta-N-acetylglucosaminyltransferase [Pseudomonadota bacterium]